MYNHEQLKYQPKYSFSIGRSIKKQLHFPPAVSSSVHIYPPPPPAPIMEDIKSYKTLEYNHSHCKMIASRPKYHNLALYKYDPFIIFIICMISERQDGVIMCASQYGRYTHTMRLIYL